MKKLLLLLGVLLLLPASAYSWGDIYANDGTYLGNTNPNQFDPNSINNQFGRYGSQFSSDSITNQFGSYGSQFSTTSPNNQFTTPGTYVPQGGGMSVPFGGYGY